MLYELDKKRGTGGATVNAAVEEVGYEVEGRNMRGGEGGGVALNPISTAPKQLMVALAASQYEPAAQRRRPSLGLQGSARSTRMQTGAVPTGTARTGCE